MSNFWFTSDCHFGHENIIRYTKRGSVVASVKEMDAWMIDSWNSVVKPGDEVYHLGDFSLFSNYNLVSDHYISKLNGTITFIHGNHDNWLTKYNYEVCNGIKPIHYLEKGLRDFMGKKRHLVLFHFPIEYWHWAESGAWHLHGHCHGNMDERNKNLFRLDVGWDSTNLFDAPIHRPYNWEEVATILNSRDAVRPNRHE